MKTVRMKLDSGHPGKGPKGRVNFPLIDATTDADILIQQKADDAEAMQDAARFARRVRKPRLMLISIAPNRSGNAPI